MTFSKTAVTVIILIGCSASYIYSQTSSSGVKAVDLGTAYVHIINEVELPARMSGPLVSFDLKRGDQVTENSVIAKVEDVAAKLQQKAAIEKHAVAEMQAKDTIGKMYADKSYEFARQKLQRAQKLFNGGAGDRADYDEAKLASEEAQLRVRKAIQDQKVAIATASLEKVTIEVAENTIERHEIRAPFDGDVMLTYKEKGEWVDAGDKVAKIVRMNRLRVIGSVSAMQYNPDEIIGRSVTVVSELARGEKVAFTGTIASVSLEQTAKKRFRVYAEVENKKRNNQWLLRPNAQVRLYMMLDE